jgi:hypothetical protein
MPWSKLRFAPGVVKDATPYSSDGMWVDSNLVRFRNGFPERWSGWSRFLPSLTMDGVCRSIHRWATLNGAVYMGYGTNRRFYVSYDDTASEVTPLRLSANLTNPFATTNGSPLVVVTHTAHGARTNDLVVFSGGAAVGGLTISGEYLITYLSDNTYQITAASNATSTTTGGGSPTAKYLYIAGATDNVQGRGWGSGTWGTGTWGDAAAASDRIGLWRQDNWGEDLVANIYDGPIFYWDATLPQDRMINIRNLPGADGYAPKAARFTCVSHRDRHLLAFGVSEEYLGITAAPMTVRWCSQEDIFNWDEADETGTAGSLPLSSGSQFIAVQPTQQEILVWSDTALYALQYTGGADVYSASIISTGTDIAGCSASTVFGSLVYWMGRSGFYAYDGRVQTMPSPVWEYVQRNMNWSQSIKVCAASNKTDNEVIWFYPSKGSAENDSYVTYDVIQQVWTVGTLARTAWLDMNFQYQPIAATPDGKLAYHNDGVDNGLTNPYTPLDAYLESAPLELSSEGSFDKGDKFVFIRRILPDVQFLTEDSTTQPTMNIVVKMMDKPGGGVTETSSSQVYQTAIIPVEQFTTECHVRLRGRSMTVRLESNTLGSKWRIGSPRFDMRTDGQR